MRRCLLLFTIVLLASPGSALGERWYKLYDQAKDDIDHQRWESAIRKLRQAVAQRADSGASVRGEGTKRMAYFPYFLMGKAYYHLGRYDEAAKFFRQEAHGNVPGRIATEIAVYGNYLQAIDEDRKRLAEFTQIVERAQAFRTRGEFREAAETLRRARLHHPAEFERRNLSRNIEEVLNLDRSRVEEKARRDRETKFMALVQDASQREKQGRLRDAGQLLLEADSLIPGRSEVATLRKRVKDREERYAQLKQSALTDQIEGKLPQALQALKQAGEADPERYNADKLAGLAASIGRQVEIENEIRARTKKLAAAQAKRQDDRGPISGSQRPVARNRREAVQAVSEPNRETVRRAVLAAYQGSPEEAVRMLEKLQSDSRTRSAELESSMGIAYARLSFLTVNPSDSERFREKAAEHFKLALALDPRHKLNSRLVAPQILDLFRASK